MRIFAASDLHFEFHNAIDWLPPLPEADAFDVMVLAGDIGTSAYLGAALRRLRYKYPEQPIILVVGNHCQWRSKSVPPGRSKSVPVGTRWFDVVLAEVRSGAARQQA